MFGVSFGELVVLVLAALFILGPERLPGAASWAGKTIRQAKQMAASAQDQVRSELGSELDVLREPLAELVELAAPLRKTQALRGPGGAARAVVSLAKKAP